MTRDNFKARTMNDWNAMELYEKGVFTPAHRVNLRAVVRRSARRTLKADTRAILRNYA